MLERHGGWRKLLLTYIVTRIVIKLLGKILLFVTEEENKNLAVNQNEEEKLTRREKLKRSLRKVLSTRGGQLPIHQIAQALVANPDILSGILLFLRTLNLRDVQVSTYYSYMRTATLEGDSENACRDVDSLFGYLFMILRDDKVPPDPEQQKGKIYKQLFENNKLRQSSKNKKYVTLFLTCAIVFLIKFSHLGTTFDAFFAALIKAVKNGKISKAVARRFIAKLKRENINLPDELLELVAIER